ncbi:tRNA threonylcarbamoyladenosine biosynthesis protein TsaE [Anaplasma platys]|uniref:tRNA threonylcarbamoyladenosine biosynthesis protein TsaE n=1 Tax=Anaplasma platys TaxID=949 RepID=A0A858PX33_9RICK|nr:tRNA (adenosine(37)-N6)-threonylcarbamoyltransferase complex ATPase subunit type 1 TsaE [Anaplasma platys]QJC27140.1 tRNA threonylcarbamoyladenosine biosynthesis protein TsaE [Anaplasma platys]
MIVGRRLLRVDLVRTRGVRRYLGLSLSDVKDVALGVSGLLASGSVVFVCGEVGAGKTVFCREIIKKLTLDPFMGSPTFPVVCEYQCPAYKLCHIDLYRINSISEVNELGIYDLIDGNVTLIEWPEILGDTLRCCLRVSILLGEQNTRNLEIEFF